MRRGRTTWGNQLMRPQASPFTASAEADIHKVTWTTGNNESHKLAIRLWLHVLLVIMNTAGRIRREVFSL